MTDAIGYEVAKCVNLVDLQLDFCTKLSKGSLQAMASNCLDLVVLSMRECAVSDSFLRALFVDLDAPSRVRRRALHTLIISKCNLLSERAADYLCFGEGLRVLDISKCEFLTSSLGLRIAGSLPALKIFDINGCPNLPRMPNLSTSHPSHHGGEDGAQSEGRAFELFLSELFALLPSAIIRA